MFVVYALVIVTVARPLFPGVRPDIVYRSRSQNSWTMLMERTPQRFPSTGEISRVRIQGANPYPP